MPLWTNKDTATGAPKYVPSGEANTIFFVDTTEAAVASNQVKGLGTPGWVQYRTYTDGGGATRHKTEVLVPMKVTAAVAGDAGSTGDTADENMKVPDS